MAKSQLTPSQLIELFAARAAASPPEANQLFARHLECKESVHLAQALCDAAHRHGERNRILPAPSEMLAPLG